MVVHADFTWTTVVILSTPTDKDAFAIITGLARTAVGVLGALHVRLTEPVDADLTRTAVRAIVAIEAWFAEAVKTALARTAVFVRSAVPSEPTLALIAYGILGAIGIRSAFDFDTLAIDTIEPGGTIGIVAALGGTRKALILETKFEVFAVAIVQTIDLRRLAPAIDTEKVLWTISVLTAFDQIHTTIVEARLVGPTIRTVSTFDTETNTIDANADSKEPRFAAVFVGHTTCHRLAGTILTSLTCRAIHIALTKARLDTHATIADLAIVTIDIRLA